MDNLNFICFRCIIFIQRDQVFELFRKAENDLETINCDLSMKCLDIYCLQILRIPFIVIVKKINEFVEAKNNLFQDFSDYFGNHHYIQFILKTNS